MCLTTPNNKISYLHHHGHSDTEKDRGNCVLLLTMQLIRSGIDFPSGSGTDIISPGTDHFLPLLSFLV